MVLEKIFKPKWLIHRTKYSFLLGVIFVIISSITSYVLFRNPGLEHLIGMGTILFTVIIALPIVNKLLLIEEKEVLKNKTFIKEHKAIIDFYIYFFLGMFVMFFILTMINPQMVFSENNLYGGTIKETQASTGLPPPPSVQGDFSKIIMNNLYVMIIAFVLSLFYGSGALFIITLNASIFGSAIARVILMRLPETGVISFALCNLGIMFFHMIPEVTSYFIAAIAGGVMSKALLKEKLWGKKFNIILTDSIKMLILSIVVLLGATWIELNITKNLIMENACIINNNLIITIAAVIIVAIIILEKKR